MSGDLKTTTWDFANQATKVELPTDEIVTYLWNSDHRQVTRENDEGTTRFHWDKNNLLLETDDNGSPLARNTHQPNEYGNLISREDLTTTDQVYYHYDALGSTAALTDPSQVTGEEYQYKAWGEQLTPTADPQPFRWVGQLGYRYDEDTERHNLRRRDYDSHLAKFLTEDPIGTNGGDANLSRYGGNDPIGNGDPSGMMKLFGESFVAPWDSRAAGVLDTLKTYGRATGRAVAGTVTGVVTGAAGGATTGAAFGTVAGSIGGLGVGAAPGAVAGAGAGVTIGGVTGGFVGLITAARSNSVEEAIDRSFDAGFIAGLASGPLPGTAAGLGLGTSTAVGTGSVVTAEGIVIATSAEVSGLVGALSAISVVQGTTVGVQTTVPSSVNSQSSTQSGSDDKPESYCPPAPKWNGTSKQWHDPVSGKFVSAPKAVQNPTAASVDDKLRRYLLNPDHPAGGNKATWFRKALGFTRDNADDLAKQITFDPAKAVATELTQFGQKFEQIIEIVGANGKRIEVLFVWIRNNDGIVRLVTSTLGV